MEEFTEELFMATSSSGAETVTGVKVRGVRKWSPGEGGAAGHSPDTLLSLHTEGSIIFNAYCFTHLLVYMRAFSHVHTTVCTKRSENMWKSVLSYHVGPGH